MSVKMLCVLALILLFAGPEPGQALSCFVCTDMPLPAGGFSGLHPLLSAVGVANSPPSCSEFESDEDRFKQDTCLPPFAHTCAKASINGREVRSCYDNTLTEGCHEDGDTTICVCSTDYCNSAGLARPAALLLLLLPALTVSLIKH